MKKYTFGNDQGVITSNFFKIRYRCAHSKKWVSPCNVKATIEFNQSSVSTNLKVTCKIKTFQWKDEMNVGASDVNFLFSNNPIFGFIEFEQNDAFNLFYQLPLVSQSMYLCSTTLDTQHPALDRSWAFYILLNISHLMRRPYHFWAVL